MNALSLVTTMDQLTLYKIRSKRVHPLAIRHYENKDHEQVRNLFVTVNRLLAPPHMVALFETYIKQSLAEEIDCIADYYETRGGQFWVAEAAGKIVGMLGLEPFGDHDRELRRMYVDPQARRKGYARQMLEFAEHQSADDGAWHLYLSTSELQDAALAFYRNAGYQQLREEVSEAATNKTIGGGIRRYYFRKPLNR